MLRLESMIIKIIIVIVIIIKIDQVLQKNSKASIKILIRLTSEDLSIFLNTREDTRISTKEGIGQVRIEENNNTDVKLLVFILLS